MLPKRGPKKNRNQQVPVNSKPTTKTAKQIVKAGSNLRCVDEREQLFNDGLIGAANVIQVSAARITQVRGLLLDIDPGLLQLQGAFGAIPNSPVELYECIVKPMLGRNDVLAKAEVRNSGTGLHVILRFDLPYQCDTDAAREDIAKVAEVVMCLLPIDPMQPGITGLTRPIGSVNSKNGAAVELLSPGEPITYAEVRKLAVQIVASPFAMFCDVLFGGERISPCPVCIGAESTLRVMPHSGMCYGCGKVTLQQLWDGLYQAGKEASHAQEK